MDWIVIAAGAFTIVGAAANWDWFMNSRKAEMFVSALGRDGARAFYGFLGAILILVGVLKAMGILNACAS